MSIKALQLIRKRISERPQELAAARKNGAKVIGWLNYNVPEEVIHALGLIPVRLGTGGNDRLVELGARYISTGNCVYTRQTTGLFAEGEDPYIRNADLVVFDAVCKQIYRVAEVVQHYFDVKTLTLGVPYNTSDPAGQRYFRKEVEALASRLGEFSGRKLKQKNLEASVALFEEIRASIRTLYDYQKRPNPPIRWLEAFEVVQAGYYLDRVEYLNLLKQLLAELAASSRSAYGTSPSEEPRLLLTGSIIPPGDRKLVQIVEQAGGRIVVDDVWSGFGLARNVRVKEASLDAIADAYLIPHASLPTLDFHGDRRLANLKELVKEYGAQGVLYHTLRYCDAFTFKAPETKRVFLELGIPFLEIHTEYAGSDVEAIRTRLEAFIELVASRDAALV